MLALRGRAQLHQVQVAGQRPGPQRLDLGLLGHLALGRGQAQQPGRGRPVLLDEVAELVHRPVRRGPAGQRQRVPEHRDGLRLPGQLLLGGQLHRRYQHGRVVQVLVIQPVRGEGPVEVLEFQVCGQDRLDRTLSPRSTGVLPTSSGHRCALSLSQQRSAQQRRVPDPPPQRIGRAPPMPGRKGRAQGRAPYMCAHPLSFDLVSRTPRADHRGNEAPILSSSAPPGSPAPRPPPQRLRTGAPAYPADPVVPCHRRPLTWRTSPPPAPACAPRSSTDADCRRPCSPWSSRRAPSSSSPRSAAGTRCAASASAWWPPPCCSCSSVPTWRRRSTRSSSSVSASARSTPRSSSPSTCSPWSRCWPSSATGPTTSGGAP